MLRDALSFILVLAGSVFTLTCGEATSPLTAPAPDQPIGAACADNGDCKSGMCLVDPSFPAGYCLDRCAAADCVEGTCHTYSGQQLCFKACDADAACRDGYVCDYGVCRPPCTDGRRCANDDRCVDGRCKPACKQDGECASDLRCQDGKCVARCKVKADCLPGFVCDTASGQCKAAPGGAMGESCTSSAKCATSYCLPGRKLCSIKCQGTADCPTGYRCALETYDSNGDTKLDAGAAACIPERGQGNAGDSCAVDADCASDHCYNGWCAEACVGDGDCGNLNCAETTLLLPGALPKFHICLPKNAVTVGRDLGTFNSGAVVAIDVPSSATSMIVTTDASDPSAIALISQAISPKGTVVSEVGASRCDEYAQTLRYAPDAGVASLYISNTSRYKLEPGIYTFKLAASKNVPIRLRVSMRLADTPRGSVDIAWLFLNLSNTCVPGSRLSAASAPSHSWLTKIRSSMAAILGKANISIGKQTFHDINAAALDVVDISNTDRSDLDALFQLTKGLTGRTIPIFVVRDIRITDLQGTVLGIAGGVPGPVGIHGTSHSGVALSAKTACFSRFGYDPGHTLAHEIGHFLGLHHNLSSPTDPGYDESTGKVYCGCPCSGDLTCHSQNGKSWCRARDPLSDSDTNNDNLMFFSADNTDEFTGNKLSTQQIRVLLDNPLVGY
ncbi:MAG: hypothetical protein H6707_09770 [Deltaproteobacteria bacterium]|nr:hypothetical protein [Deltaproteobacteria bacterium]